MMKHTKEAMDRHTGLTGLVLIVMALWMLLGIFTVQQQTYESDKVEQRR